VCETKYSQDTVESEYPECETVEEEVCQGDICKTFPRVQCQIKTRPELVNTPETSCKTIPANICGPEACPVEEGEETCWDELRDVSLIESSLNLLLKTNLKGIG
jgi:hypothetical protein